MLNRMVVSNALKKNRLVPRELGRTLSTQPSLVTVPSLPIVGSLVSAYSGLEINPSDFNATVRKWSQQYGPFYRFGFPGLGKDWHGTAYVTSDPEQLMKVLKAEGSFPTGGAERERFLIEWFKRRDYKIRGLYGRGQEWKRIRSFMQKDLLSPQSAKEYLPAMLRVAPKSSAKAATMAEQGNIRRFLNFFAMDLFNALHFGGQDELSDEDYQAFAVAAVDGLGLAIQLNRDNWAKIGLSLGYKTKAVTKCFDALDRVHDISQRRQKEVLQRFESGTLTDIDKESYFYKSLQRQNESDLTLEEILEIGVVIMVSSVDTTSAKTSWNVLQLAVNPEVQDRLRTEIRKAVEKEGGLTPAVVELPYLKAFIRETHRCTPTVPLSLFKELQAPTEIHGVELPAGTIVCFDQQTAQFNPEFVEDPMRFDPERWLPEAVAARKNTPAAIIDHPFFSGPFSQGARRCPGSRVAYLEVQTILAQLLLDWNIQGPAMHWSDVPSALEALIVPVFPNDVRFLPLSA